MPLSRFRAVGLAGALAFAVLASAACCSPKGGEKGVGAREGAESCPVSWTKQNPNKPGGTAQAIEYEFRRNNATIPGEFKFQCAVAWLAADGRETEADPAGVVADCPQPQLYTSSDGLCRFTVRTNAVPRTTVLTVTVTTDSGRCGTISTRTVLAAP